MHIKYSHILPYRSLTGETVTIWPTARSYTYVLLTA